MPSWRDTLFFWRGTIEDATWSGTWVGVNSAKGAAGAMPSEEQFAGSANKFALTLERADGAALAAAQVTRRALPDALTARAHTRGAGAPAGSERAREGERGRERAREGERGRERAREKREKREKRERERERETPAHHTRTHDSLRTRHLSCAWCADKGGR